MRRLMRNPIVMIVVGFVAGVALGDKVKPMMANIPVVGKFFAN